MPSIYETMFNDPLTPQPTAADTVNGVPFFLAGQPPAPTPQRTPASTGGSQKKRILEPSEFPKEAAPDYQKLMEEEFFSGVKKREQSMQDRQKELIALGEKPTGWKAMDLSPLLAWTDTLSDRTNMAQSYNAPKGAQEWEQKKALLQSAIDKSQDGISADRLGYMKMKSDADMAKEEAAWRRTYQSSLMNKEKELSPTAILNVNEGNAIPSMLDDVGRTIDDNSDLFSPFTGAARSWNPFDTKAQTIGANIKSTAQAFGRYMEGGVLRKEDEAKYRDMFPQLGDTPDVAKNKLAIVRRLLITRQNSNVGALKNQGYNMKGIDQQLIMPDRPAILGGDSGSSTSMMTDAQKARLQSLRSKHKGGPQ